MPPTRSRKHRRSKRRWPFAWLVILGLIWANIATFLTLWGLLSSQGQASASLGVAPALFLLPEATPGTEPTATATRVATYLPTATVTPTPTPTPPPTATSPPPPAIVVVPAAAPAQPKINHVVIISIDGLRPDALEFADTPTLDNFIVEGAYSPTAQTVSLSVTLPSHASMLSGMTPDKHGLQWGLPYIGWPGLNGPTLLSLAHDNGLSTAMVFGKDKLHHLILPDSVDKLFGADVHDEAVKAEVVAFVEAGLPNVLFIHFPDVDRVGHEYGWMSDNQFQAITFVDSLIGEIVAALDGGGYLGRTLLIVTSDHGGQGTGHGDDSPLDRTIPWLAVGPGVRSGLTLTKAINTYDTAATVAYALELPLPEVWDGRPVLEIFE